MRVFQREGDDLHMVVPIAVHEAALGAQDRDPYAATGRRGCACRRARSRVSASACVSTARLDADGQRGDLDRRSANHAAATARRAIEGAAPGIRPHQRRERAGVDVAKRAERGKAYYMISAVSQKYDIHPQTLRLYEREGLLKPSRTEGNTRLYSEEDLEQLETILTLTRDLGVNLAGVEIILNLRRKIEQMQGEVNQFMDYVKSEMARGIDDWEQRLGTALVKSTPTDLVRRTPPQVDASKEDEKPKRQTKA